MLRLSEKNAVLLVVVFGSFISPFLFSAVNIALPTIGTEYNVDSISLNWVPTAYLLAIAVIILPAGRLSDLYGMRKMYFAGMFLSSITTLLCAVAPAFSFLIAARVAQGLSVGMALGIGPAMLTVTFPPEQRGRVLGISTAAVYIGISAGPIVSGALVQNFGWRSVFWVIVFYYLMVAILTKVFIKTEWISDKKVKFDIKGSLLYAAGMVLLIYGISEIPSASAIVFAVAGLFVFIFFFFYEWRIDNAMLNLRLLKSNRVFIYSNIATLINYSSTNAISYLLSLNLQYYGGLKPFNAGLVLFLQPVVQAVFSPIAGRISDRIQPGKVASFGMGLTCAGILLLVLETFHQDLSLIILSLVVLGLGFAFFASPNTNAIMSAVDRRQYGVASSTIATMRTVGQVFSMGIVMSVFSLVLGRVQITPEVFAEFSLSLRIILIVMALLSLAGVFVSLVRNKGNPAETVEEKK